ncbi:hypothetical protein Vafri_5901, partial [Volvox africanus]
MFAADPRCFAVNTESSSSEKTWLQYPAWFNAIFLESAEASMSLTSAKRLPQPSNFTDGPSMHNYYTQFEKQSTTTVTFTTADASGVGLDDTLQDGSGYEHLTENSCTDRVHPLGPLHPRTFLLMWYRADTLGALGFHSPPDHWEELLDLLKVHKAASREKGASLPQYGLCITDSPHCGRAGDVLAAVAASVVQSRGTSQGYAFDLSVPPPAAEPLVNSIGWRYAADLTRKMLSYNAPDNDTMLLAEMLSPDCAKSLDCHALSPYFTGGSCMVTLEWDAALPHMAAAAPLQRPGVLGVAPLPGSRWIVPPQDIILKVCDRDTCRLSIDHEMLYSPYGMYSKGAALPDGPMKSNVDTELASLPTPLEEFVELESAAAAAAEGPVNKALEERRSLLVNRAPYSAFYGVQTRIQFAGMVVRGNVSNMPYAEGLNKLLEFRTLRQRITDAVRADLGVFTTKDSDAQNCTAYAGFGWWAALWRRTNQLAEVTNATGMSQPLPPAFNISKLEALGLDPYTARSYLRTLWTVLHHPNAAPDVQSPSLLNWYRWGLGWAALGLIPNTTSSALTTSDVDNTHGNGTESQSVPAATPANELLLEVFRRSIELTGSSAAREAYMASIAAADGVAKQSVRVPAAGNSPSRRGKSGLSHGALAGAIIGPQAVVLAVVAAVMALMWRRRSRARRHRDLLGRVRAPQVGPDTTLLITDVQNSTVLWEALPVTTMDCALRAHNACIRQTLAKYDGYESATEGDSFIVAFASPASATAFAVSCQLALLEADWPQELLQHPDGAMVLVEPRDPAITWGAAPPPLVPTPPLPGHAPRSGATTLAAGASAGTLQLPNAGVQALTIAGGSFPPQAPSMAVSSPHGWGVGGLLRWSAALTAHSRHCCSSSQIQLQPVCSPQSRRPSWNNVQHILTTAAFNYGGARVTTPGSAYGAAATGAATTTTTTTVATTTAATTAATTTAATATTAMAAATCSRFLDTSPQTAAPQSLALASPFSSPPPPMIMLLQQPPLITQSVSTRAVCAAAATTGAPPARVFTSCTSTGMATSETPPRLTFNELLPTGSPAAAILTARESANGGGGPGGSCISFRGGKVSAPPCLSEHQNFPIPPARDFPSQPPDGTAAAAAAVAAEFTTTTAGPALKVYNRLEALQHDSGDDLMASSGLVSLNNANSANLDSSTSDGGAWCTWQELLTATFPIVQAFAAAMSPGAMAATDGAMGTESSAAASVRLTRDRDQACVRLVDGRIVAFRGLRVRMGLHSGLDNPNHVFFNRVSSSYHYSGEFAEVTRLVSDSAPGGLVVMSGLAFGRLRHCVEQGGWGGCGGGGSGGLKAGGGRGSIAMKDIKVIYAGHHLLKAGGGGGIGHGIVSACGCRGAGVGTGAISTCGFGDGSSSMNDGLCAYACRASDRIPSYMSRPFTLSPLGRKVSGRTLSPGMSGMYDPPSNTALYGSCICGDSAAVAAGIHTQSVGIGRGGGGGGSVAAATSIAGPSTLLATHSLPIEADESQLVEPDDCPAASSYFNRQEVPITAPITTRLEAPAAVFPLAASTTSLVATSTTPHALALRQDTPMPRSPSGHVVRQETPTAQRSPLSRWLAPQPLQQLSPVTALLMAPGPPPQLQAHDAPIGARLTKDLRSSVWSRKLKRFFPGYSYMPTKPDGTWHGTPPTLPQPLYVAVPSGLLCRLALVPPLRSRWVSQLSSLDA